MNLHRKTSWGWLKSWRFENAVVESLRTINSRWKFTYVQPTLKVYVRQTVDISVRTVFNSFLSIKIPTKTSSSKVEYQSKRIASPTQKLSLARVTTVFITKFFAFVLSSFYFTDKAGFERTSLFKCNYLVTFSSDFFRKLLTAAINNLGAIKSGTVE